MTDIERRFHDRHEAFYGFRAEGEAVEIINFRLQATGELTRITPTPAAIEGRDPTPARIGERQAWVESEGKLVTYQIYARERLHPGAVLTGPAIVEQTDSTTVIPPQWTASVNSLENLIIGREEWQQHD